MQKLILITLLSTSLLFAGKVDKIIDNEGLESVSNLYRQTIIGFVDMLSGQIDSSESQRVKAALENSLDSVELYSEYKRIIQEVLSKDEIKITLDVYKKDIYKKYKKATAAFDEDTAAAVKAIEAAQQLYLVKMNGGEHPYFEKLKDLQSAYVYDYSGPLVVATAGLIDYMNTLQPTHFQIADAEIQVMKENLKKSFDMLFNNILYLAYFKMVDDIDDIELDSILAIQLEEEYVKAGNKVGYAITELFSKRLSNALIELEN